MAYNNYFPAGYQPAQIVYPTQPNAVPTQQSVGSTQSALTWVQGEAGAKSYLVAPNSTVVLWDSETPTIYITSSDAISDFEKLKSDVEEMKKNLKSQIESEKGKEKSK